MMMQNVWTEADETHEASVPWGRVDDYRMFVLLKDARVGPQLQSRGDIELESIPTR